MLVFARQHCLTTLITTSHCYAHEQKFSLNKRKFWNSFKKSRYFCICLKFGLLKAKCNNIMNTDRFVIF